MVLNRNPDNYFAETEQVAFHLGHVVPGIDFSNDPLLQGRLFSISTPSSGGWAPTSHSCQSTDPRALFSNNQRDGMLESAIDSKGRVAYFTKFVGGGCPAHSPESMERFTSYAEKMEGTKVRQRSASFSDHFSQATLFWNSMADWEKKHIVEAFSFELNQVDTLEIRERVINGLLANVASELAERVAEKIGFKNVQKSTTAKTDGTSSPALSMDKIADSIKGRKVGILAADGVNAADIITLKTQLESQGAKAHVIARAPGTLQGEAGESVLVDKPAANAPSVFYDAVFIPGGSTSAQTLSSFGPAIHFVNEAFAHGKPIAAVGDGVEFLNATTVGELLLDGAISAPEPLGIISGTGDAASVIEQFVEAMKKHRFFARDNESVPA